MSSDQRGGPGSVYQPDEWEQEFSGPASDVKLWRQCFIFANKMFLLDCVIF